MLDQRKMRWSMMKRTGRRQAAMMTSASTKLTWFAAITAGLSFRRHVLDSLHAQTVTVQRAQLDDAQAVQAQPVAHAFGHVDAIGSDNLLRAPLAHAADRHQQPAVGHHRLLQRQFAEQRPAVRHPARQVGGSTHGARDIVAMKDPGKISVHALHCTKNVTGIPWRY